MSYTTRYTGRYLSCPIVSAGSWVVDYRSSGDVTGRGVNYLQVSVTYVGYHYSGDALDVNNELLAAMTEQFDEGAFDAVVYSAYDSNRGALAQVNFLRTQVAEFVNVLLAKGYELLHLFVGDDDGDVATKTVGTGVILQITETTLEFLNAVLLAVYEQQVVYCRDKG